MVHTYTCTCSKSKGWGICVRDNNNDTRTNMRTVVIDIYVYKSGAMEGLNWGHERNDAIKCIESVLDSTWAQAWRPPSSDQNHNHTLEWLHYHSWKHQCNWPSRDHSIRHHRQQSHWSRPLEIYFLKWRLQFWFFWYQALRTEGTQKWTQCRLLERYRTPTYVGTCYRIYQYILEHYQHQPRRTYMCHTHACLAGVHVSHMYGSFRQSCHQQNLSQFMWTKSHS